MEPNNDVAPKLRMVLTSSMAAVRATNQPPINGKYYTHKDWNTLSTLDEKNWGSCYQWSKMESERQVLQLAQDRADGSIEFVALCPSFIFGPPPPHPSSLDRGNESRGSSSYSIELVKKWLSGESEVQSRLCVDVRDVALAHVQAGTIDLSQLATDSANCHRYILSTEERLSSEKVADALKNAIRKTNVSQQQYDLDTKIRCDTVFDGGAIKIGEKEVDATNRLKDLGVVCRSVEETMEGMATCLLDGAL
jgi:nucleoside-diphosphate-sugar epimerase